MDDGVKLVRVNTDQSFPSVDQDATVMVRDHCHSFTRIEHLSKTPVVRAAARDWRRDSATWTSPTNIQSSPPICWRCN